MTYKIEFTTRAEKQFFKLPVDVQARIIACLKRCRIRPYVHVIKLVDSPYYRLRVGNYRVIIDLHDEKLLILVITLGHRSSIYLRDAEIPKL